MNTKRFVILFLVSFLLWCGYLVFESALSVNPANGGCILLAQTNDINTQNPAISAPPQSETTPQEPAQPAVFIAENAPQRNFIIGADDPNTEDPEIETNFKLHVELTSKGAGIKKVVFSNGKGNGFSNRDPDNPKPLTLLSPAKRPGQQEITSMQSGALVFTEHKQRLPLDKLNWQCAGVETAADGCEKATFVAEIKDQATGQKVLKVTKLFDIIPGSYMMHCHIYLENLSGKAQEVAFKLNGPAGIDREAVRSDMRKAVAAFINTEGQIQSKTISLSKAQKADSSQELKLKSDSMPFLWAAATNKYFAAIAVPVPHKGQKYCDWLSNKQVSFYDAQTGDDDDNTLGIDFTVAAHRLAPAGTDQSSVEYKFELYLGPKDKELFDNNEYYNRLGFIHTIDFIACCCPAAIIRPLAFFILWLMNTLYTAIPNYGIIIIILVFIVRLVLHPVTKSGQVRMSRFTKILSSPEVQAIRKKYAKNRMEMQKRISEFQKSRGVSPADALFGMLPMMVQMPLWIALWSSVNSSIDLRGAAFLPFWITDLSVPDALIRWPAITVPLIGKISSLNLLPILMGVGFYLQQKTMPQQPAATPEAAQQQKIMRIMMLVMFPIILYNAPSGVSLYIMASSFAGAIEQSVIRKHISEKEQAEAKGLVEVTSKTGGKVKKKKPKPFFKNF